MSPGWIAARGPTRQQASSQTDSGLTHVDLDVVAKQQTSPEEETAAAAPVATRGAKPRRDAAGLCSGASQLAAAEVARG